MIIVQYTQVDIVILIESYAKIWYYEKGFNEEKMSEKVYFLGHFYIFFETIFSYCLAFV